MAVTKIHPIRRTLSKSVKYITDPRKTEDELYVSCFGCTRENLVSEFTMTRSCADKESPILAQHLIQSFAKGEIDAATAHAIGRELADRFTGGKHEYIIATHLDRGHIHNHIIFNHIDFVDHHCFHSDANKLRELRKLNDEICEDHGLSVIKNPRNQGKTYYEWAMERLGHSYKKKLRDNIDMLIPVVHSYGELLIKLQDMGYEIKTGKYDSFRMDGQERFTRSKTLGADYTKEAIIDRINNSKVGPYVSTVKKPAYIRVWKYDQKLGLIENTGNYLLFIQSNYTKQRMAIQNAKKLAATYNLLKEKGIDSAEKLNETLKESKTSIKETRETVRDIETKIAGINDTIKYVERVTKFQPVYREYLISGKSPAFLEAHRSEIMLYESAKKTLEQKGLHGESVQLSKLNKERNALEEKRIDMAARLDSLQAAHHDLLTAKKNVEVILSEDKESQVDKSRGRSSEIQ